MITVKDVSMVLAAAGRSVTILDRITFEIPTKQTVAIVGPSGSGKSTLLGLMAGLDRPTTGSIRLDGTDITTMGESQMARFRREKVGYIFQSFHLIPTLTAIENVAVPLELSGLSRDGDRARELLACGRAVRPHGALSGSVIRGRTTTSRGGPGFCLSSPYPIGG